LDSLAQLFPKITKKEQLEFHHTTTFCTAREENFQFFHLTYAARCVHDLFTTEFKIKLKDFVSREDFLVSFSHFHRAREERKVGKIPHGTKMIFYIAITFCSPAFAVFNSQVN
jgi:hypothetical protein